MQLGKLLEEVYIACGLQVLRRAATGGSTTTVVDTTYANRKGDNFFSQGSNGGYILFVSQTTDRAAPEAEYGEVSAFVNSGGPTFTVPTLTAAVGAADIYAVMKPTIQLYEMISRINEGLRKLTETERVDTSLTGLSNTLAYNLPLPIHRYKILDIQIGSDTYGWQDAPGYDITPATGSTPDKLIFTNQPPFDSSTPTNQTIKIRYQYAHPTLSVYSDYVEKSITDDAAIRVCTEAAYELLMHKRPNLYTSKPHQALWEEIQRKAEQARQEHPTRVKPASRQPRINLGEL